AFTGQFAAACHIKSFKGPSAGGFSRNGPESVLDCGASIVKAVPAVKLCRLCVAHPSLPACRRTGIFQGCDSRRGRAVQGYYGTVMGLLRKLRAAVLGLALVSAPAAA